MTGRKRTRDNPNGVCQTTAARAATESPVDPALDAYVERIVRDAPPFSARQRARIAAILHGDEPTLRSGCRQRRRKRGAA